MPARSNAGSSFHFSTHDLLAVLVLLATASMFTLDRLDQGVQIPFVTGDAGVYASQAAAMLWPENFESDPLLRLGWSMTPAWMVLFFPVTIGLFKILGDFQIAFTAPVLPLVFLQGLGFYLLGRSVFGSRYKALLFSLACYLPVDGTYWYVQKLAMGRMWYSAYYPFLILLFLRFAPNPRHWPWLMMAAGAGMYVHPVSTPVVGFAVYAGLLAFRPSDWSWPRTITYMVLCGLAFVLAALPFIIANLAVTVDSTIFDYDGFLRARSWSGNAFISVGHYVQHIFSQVNVLALLSCGIAGGWVAWRLREGESRHLAFMTYCTVGLLFASILIPWVEIETVKRLEMRPQLDEAVRSIRYVMPNAVYFILAGLLAAMHRLKLADGGIARIWRDKVIMSGAAATVFVGLYGASVQISPTPPYVFAWYQFVPFLQTLQCWKRGHFRCPLPSVDEITPVIDHLRQNYPSKVRVLPFLDRHIGLQVSQASVAAIIRYSARLPVAFSFHEELLPFYGRLDKDAYLWRYMDYRQQYFVSYHDFEYVTPRPLPTLEKLVQDLAPDVLVTDLRLMAWQEVALGLVTFRTDTVTVIDLRDSARKRNP